MMSFIPEGPWYERGNSTGESLNDGAHRSSAPAVGYGRSEWNQDSVQQPTRSGGYQERSGSWSAPNSAEGTEQLMTRRVSSPEGASSPNYGASSSATSGTTGHLSSAKSTWAEVTAGLPKSAASRITDAADRTASGASSAMTSVGRWLGDTSERAGALGESALEKARRLGSSVGGSVSSATSSFTTSELKERVSSGWGELRSGASGELNGATKSIDEWSEGAKHAVGDGLKEAESKWDGALQSTKGAVGEAANSALHSFGSTIGDTVGSAREAFNGASNSFNEFGQGIGDVAKSALHNAQSSLASGVDSTKLAIGDAVSTVNEFGSSVGSDLSTAASSAVHSAGSTIGEAVDSLNDAKGTITEFGSGVGRSVSSAVDRAGSTLEGAIDYSRSAIGDAASTAAHGIDATLEAAAERTKGAFSGATNSISEMGSSIGDSASTAAHTVGSTIGDAASSVSQLSDSAFTNARSGLESAAESTKSAIGDASSSLSQFGSSLGSKFGSSIGDLASNAAHGFGYTIDDASSSLKSGLGDIGHAASSASNRVGETLSSVGDKGSEWLSSARSSISNVGHGITDSLSSAATRAGNAIDSTAHEGQEGSSSFLSSVSSTVSGWFLSSSASTSPSEIPEITTTERTLEEHPTGAGLLFLARNIGSTVVNWMTREEDQPSTPAPEETPSTTETPQTTTEQLPTEPTPSSFASVGSTLISWFSSSVAKSAETADQGTETTTLEPAAATTQEPATTTTEDPRPGLISSAGSAVYNWLTSEDKPNEVSSTAKPDATVELTPGPDGSDAATDVPTQAPDTVTTEPNDSGDGQTNAGTEETASTDSTSTFAKVGSTIVSWFSSSSSTAEPTSSPDDVTTANAETTHLPDGIFVGTSEAQDGQTAAYPDAFTTESPSMFSSVGSKIAGWFSSSSSSNSVEPTEATGGYDAPKDATTEQPSDAGTSVAQNEGNIQTTAVPEDKVGSTIVSWFSSSNSGESAQTSTPTEGFDNAIPEPITESSSKVAEPSEKPGDAFTTQNPEVESPSTISLVGSKIASWFSSSSSGTPEETTNAPDAGETPKIPSYIISEETTVPSTDVVNTAAVAAEQATTAATSESTASVEAVPVEETSTGPSLLTSIGQTVSGWFSSSSSSSADSPRDNLLETTTVSSDPAVSTMEKATAASSDSESPTTAAFDLTTTLSEPVTEQSTIPTAESGVTEDSSTRPESTDPSLLSTIGSTMSGWFSSSPERPESETMVDASSANHVEESSTVRIIDGEATTISASDLTPTAAEPEAITGQSITASIGIGATEGPLLPSESTDPSLISTIGSKLTGWFSSSSSPERPSSDSMVEASSATLVEEMAPVIQSSTPSASDVTNMLSVPDAPTTVSIDIGATADPSAAPESTDPSLISTIGSKITGWFASSSSNEQPVSESAVETSSATPSEESSTAPISNQDASTISSFDVATSQPAVASVTTPIDSESSASPDSTDTSLISTIGSKISGWFSSSSSSEQPTSEATVEGSTALPAENQTPSINENPSVNVASSTDRSVPADEYTTAASLDDSSTISSSTSPEEVTDEPSLVTSIGLTIASWFGSATSDSPQSSDFIKPDKDETPTMTSSEVTSSTDDVEIPAVTTEAPEETSTHSGELSLSGEESDPSTTSHPFTFTTQTPDETSTMSSGELSSSVEGGDSSTTAHPFSFTTQTPEQTSTVREEFKPSGNEGESSTTSHPFSFTTDTELEASKSLGELPASGYEGELPTEPLPIVFTTTPTPDDNSIVEETSTSATPQDESISSGGEEEGLNTNVMTERRETEDSVRTTESLKIIVNEITDATTISSSSEFSAEEKSTLNQAIADTWSWLEHHVADRTEDWKHIWEWMYEEEKEQQEIKNANASEIFFFFPKHPRSDSGYQQSITPKWLWDQASGSLRYARDSPTPTVNGKSLCSALVSSSEFDNDERGTRKVRSPFTPIPYAGYNYYWDANFLPIIVRPQRRSICTHIISREEMDEKVEIWNGTRLVGNTNSLRDAPRNTSSSTNVTPVQHMPEFGTEPHPPGPSTRPSQYQLYGPEVEPVSFIPPPPTYTDVKYYA
ncbi:hypothetical protein PENTCL1PPCAC_7497 [Pristionchus entomophagus]|uniref:Uncharacterized protein n=1 Tax=Pristionchus entomophagus TaxID=358040 RepID=A0AAV5SS95_9BILA|nr:hypothetical protein PENTCL1PPCAC_7497 [Pristionchus entomophagus]